MSYSRAFVGFSNTDIHYYRMMQAWKKNSKFDFNFIDCQLIKAINSNDEIYIKRKLRERINMSSTFISLIGEDTRRKHKFVRWEMEVALEKNCRIIGVNLNGKRQVDEILCPPILRNKGVVFLPFSPAIIAHALDNFGKEESDDWHFEPFIYSRLGYK